MPIGPIHHERPNDVYGIGSCLVDLIVPGDDRLLNRVGIPKSQGISLDAPTAAALKDIVADRNPEIAGGGSMANSLAMIGRLGGSGHLCAKVGDDRYGPILLKELAQLGITLGPPLVLNCPTGISIVIVTTDGERSIGTHLSPALLLGPDDLDEEAVLRSRWAFVEGYQFLARESSTAAHRLIELAKHSGTPVALSLSDVAVIERAGATILDLLPDIDLVFANEAEAQALSGQYKLADVERWLAQNTNASVVTRGSSGSLLSYDRHSESIDPYAVEAVDATGAGDAFAGGFLYGLSRGYSPKQSAIAGSFLASRVVAQRGARLRGVVSWGEWEKQ